jgi:AAA domain
MSPLIDMSTGKPVQAAPETFAATALRGLYRDVLKHHEARRLHGLMYGDDTEQAAYDKEYGSGSEADAHLFALLALGLNDGDAIERIARTSTRYREKWDKHRSYLGRSIQWALNVTAAEYQLRQRRLTAAVEAEAAPPTFTLRGYSDAAIHTMPDPVWLIEGLLPAGGLVEVVGRYGAGKTFLFIDWLMHVAGGMPWQGRTVQRGPCLYVYGEGHMKPRVAAWRAAHQVAADTALGVTYAPGTVNLLNDAAVDAFIEQVVSETFGPKPVVIALDTLSRMAPGDENSPEHGALVVAACERIQRATGAAVIIGHHTPWDLDRQRPKGSSKVPDCADAVFLLENTDGALKLTCQKMRDAETASVLHLKLTPVPPALVVDAGTAPATPLDQLCDALHAGPLTKKELQVRLGKSERTVDGLIKDAGPQVAVVTGTGVRGVPAKFMLIAV